VVLIINASLNLELPVLNKETLLELKNPADIIDNA